LVRALEDDWRNAIDATLRARGWPALTEVRRLGTLTARLSDAYNEAGGDASKELLPARLAFSFARDVPKGAAAVRELVATRALALLADRALRVLDFGAGLGAMTWGVARALEEAGGAGTVDATWIEPDARALEVGLELLRAAPRGRVEVRVRSQAGVIESGRRTVRERFDLVMAGQVLSEMDSGLGDAERVARHAERVGALMSSLEDKGSLVIVEPALRDRTRHLHRVRDALLAAGTASVFAPCLHANACPALAREADWCHEDLPVDLPPWLVPIARAAGLRWQGLTFSYLVLRKDGYCLEDTMPESARLRAVSELIVSKGKKEAFLCGRRAPQAPGERFLAVRLDRDASAANNDWNTLRRGDLFTTAELVSPRPRITRDTNIARAPLPVGPPSPKR
jgi:SAM-dependent methyltransferase